MHNTFIEIDTKQFINNIKYIRSIINSNVKYCLPVKANAYGHGILQISKLAEEFVDYLAVANLTEGIILRSNGITKPIIVFGAFTDDQIPELIKYNLEVTLSSLYKAKLILTFCELNKKACKVHIKVDTGMNRIGMRPDTVINLIDFVLSKKEFDLIGIYSHLASAEENEIVTKHQLEEFKKIVLYIKNKKQNVICHLANSGGVLFWPESFFDMVRPGILSYGYSPIENFNIEKIKPCFSLKSKVAYFKVVEKYKGLSYNHTYITQEKTRIVTIPIGYGDGYRRILSNTGEVIIRGKKFTISGTICMDMLLVDIGIENEAYVGDEVVLIGKQDNL